MEECGSLNFMAKDFLYEQTVKCKYTNFCVDISKILAVWEFRISFTLSAPHRFTNTSKYIKKGYILLVVKDEKYLIVLHSNISQVLISLTPNVANIHYHASGM